jgi:hypothetical protein
VSRRQTRFEDAFVPVQDRKDRAPAPTEAVIDVRRSLLVPRPIDEVDEMLRELYWSAVTDVFVRCPVQGDYVAKFGVLFRFAIFDHDTFGNLDLRRAFQDERINAYVSMFSPENGTPGTYRSTLHWIRAYAFPDLAPRKIVLPRIPPKAPYSTAHNMQVWKACEGVPAKHAQYAARFRLMVALAAGAGARTGEIERLFVGDVTPYPIGEVADSSFPTAAIRLVDQYGVPRVVPIGGKYGDYIVRAAADRPKDQLLFWHDKGSLTGRVEATVDWGARRMKFARRYLVSRGRGAWLLNLLSQDISFFEIMQIAGIRAGTHTPTDFIRFAAVPPQPSRALIRAVTA